VEKLILSGNEAIALGAYEAGVTVGTGYPGTPSTEILENLTRYDGVYTEWSVNEKTAFEVGIGAAAAGARTIVTMKHVGLNVAADPLFTAVYVGVKAGLVVICADDPAMHSSQNEQDSRHYAVAAKVPMLEPSDSQEACDLVRAAFALSERYDTPVLIRSTTRVSHGKSVVSPEGSRRHFPGASGFERNARKWVMIPAYARERHAEVEKRLVRLAEAAESMEVNRTELRSTELGFITSGACYTYVREAYPEASVLKLGMVHPLPRRRIAHFLREVKQVFVVEELDPLLQDAINAMHLRGEPLLGKELFPITGELSPTLIAAPLEARGLKSALEAGVPLRSSFAVPPRPPSLCPGCPHRSVFQTLNRLGVVVTGDIGCYTLGALPPFSAMDTCVEMGASIGVAQGIEIASRVAGGVGRAAGAAGDPARPYAGRTVAVIGDSTFAHSGVTGLMNAAYNGRTTLNIVLDNGTTAMTGMQPNPLSGQRIDGKTAPALDYAKLAEAVGIASQDFRVVDAYKPRDIDAAITALLDGKRLSLLVVKGLCVILKRKRKE
jgi:indolepyruvate ferredoxin oxidoreductase, alpha subunit